MANYHSFWAMVTTPVSARKNHPTHNLAVMKVGQAGSEFFHLCLELFFIIGFQGGSYCYNHELVVVVRQDIELKVFAIYAPFYPLAGVAYSNSGFVEKRTMAPSTHDSISCSHCGNLTKYLCIMLKQQQDPERVKPE
jgi:hypothetical protein